MPAFALPLPLPRQAERALPRGGVGPMLTLAAEPEVVRGDGLHRPVVALCSVAFSSSLTPRSRRRPQRGRENITAACSPPPACPSRSAGRSGVVSQPAARAQLRAQPPRPPRPGPAAGASAPPESLLAPATRAPGVERWSQRPEEKRASEAQRWPGQVVALRRWSPSSGSVWPTRSTARTSPSAATSPRPR